MQAVKALLLALALPLCAQTVVRPAQVRNWSQVRPPAQPATRFTTPRIGQLNWTQPVQDATNQLAPQHLFGLWVIQNLLPVPCGPYAGFSDCPQDCMIPCPSGFTVWFTDPVVTSPAAQ